MLVASLAAPERGRSVHALWLQIRHAAGRRVLYSRKPGPVIRENVLMAEHPILRDVIVDKNSVDSAVRKLKVNIISYINIFTSMYPWETITIATSFGF